MSAPRMTQAEYDAYQKRRNAQKAANQPVEREEAPKVVKWTQAERSYFYGVLGGTGKYEGEELRITPSECEKHSYTPDFVTELEQNYQVGGHTFLHQAKVYHEVKGEYRLQSQDGARLRWCFAAISHPSDVFVWAKMAKTKGYWDIEVWYDGGRTRLKGKKVRKFVFNNKGGVEWLK